MNQILYLKNSTILIHHAQKINHIRYITNIKITIPFHLINKTIRFTNFKNFQEVATINLTTNQKWMKSFLNPDLNEKYFSNHIKYNTIQFLVSPVSQTSHHNHSLTITPYQEFFAYKKLVEELFQLLHRYFRSATSYNPWSC